MSLAEILGRIRAAERQAGRPEGSVKLIAVSKVQPLDRVEAVAAASACTCAMVKCATSKGIPTTR